MIDQLTDLVKQYAGDAIISNPAIPDERNDEAIGEASQSIFGGLKNAISNGNLSEVTNMFNSGQSAINSPVTQNIQGDFVKNLMHKFGLDNGKATQIAGALIPIVIQKFVHKTNDPNDKSFDLTSILGSLTGNAGGGLNDVLGKFTGGDQQAAGGMLDKVKGFFN